MRPMSILLLVAGLAWGGATRSAIADLSKSQADRVQRLIAELGSRDYFARERAQDELARIGFEAFDALTLAEDHEDIEVASRAAFLVRQMQVEWTVESDPPEVKRLLQNYSMKDEAERLAAIDQLARLPGDQGLGVLCRLVRFEKSPLVSKVAALKFVESHGDKEADWLKRGQLVASVLGSSTRPGAAWLRTYASARKDPAAAAAEWGRHAEQEEVASKQSPESQPEFAAALWKQQAALWKRLDRRDEAVAAMMRVVALEDGEPETLTELLEWLVKLQAWPVVDEVATRFADRINGEPLLLYMLAQARQAQGNDSAAQETAQRAFGLNPGNSSEHASVALRLEQRGLLAWAEQEYRQAIKLGQPGDRPTLLCQFKLAELLYDRMDFQSAAKMLQEVDEAVRAKGREALQTLPELGRTPESNLARMHFFLSCHHEAAGDRAKQIEHLKQGFAQDSTDVDVLIAMFRTPGLEDELREKMRESIRETSDLYRRVTEDEPNDPVAYNQYAWLVANTEGDKQDALKASQRSLELMPNNPGFTDTLARCYYAVGDLENAVKYQAQAVEGEPHSGQMQRQLAVFREALEKQKAKKP